MTAKKLSIYLFTASVVFATTLHLLFRFYQHRYFLLIYENYNTIPIADISFWITSNVLNIIYNGYHVPITVETYLWEVVVIVLFGLQCVIIGLVLFKIWELIKRKYYIKNKN